MSAAVGLQVAQHFHWVVRVAHDEVGGRRPAGVLAAVLSHCRGADLEVMLSETASQVGARGSEGPPGPADVVDDEDVDLRSEMPGNDARVTAYELKSLRNSSSGRIETVGMGGRRRAPERVRLRQAVLRGRRRR
jgi:hypothetical protein